MDKLLKKHLLEESLSIGELLLKKAISHKKGIYWESLKADSQLNTYWEADESVYSGVSGIVLFMLTLYRHTKDKKYLAAGVKATNWLEDRCREKSTANYAFFGGRMGVAYTMLQVSDYLKDKNYLQKALYLIKDCTSSIDDKPPVCDLLNGISGTILGLLHLHAASREEWLLDCIYSFVDQLLQYTFQGPKGIYWDHSHQQIKGICGFSHGAGGIGYVWLELGRYFQNQAFYWLAEQAFLYENQYFDEEKREWPDFRKGIFSKKDLEKHKEAYWEGNKAFFYQPNYMAAWCHGSAGIGLARLKAWELLQKERYLQDFTIAVKNIIATNIEDGSADASFIVCHGGAGNAMLLLEAFRLLGEKKYLAFAEKIALKALDYKKKNGGYRSGYYFSDEEDISLFMGIAGIGYFYLQLLYPQDTTSIVRPGLPAGLPTNLNAEKPEAMDLASLQARLLSQVFPLTFASFKPTLTGSYTETVHELRVNFMSSVEKHLHLSPDSYLEEVCKLEKEKWNLTQSVESWAYLYIKQYIETEKNLTFLQNNADERILTSFFVHSSHIKIIETARDFSSGKTDKQNDQEVSEKYFVLLHLSIYGVRTHHLSDFSYIFFTYFSSLQCGITALEKLAAHFDISEKNDMLMIKNAFIGQLKEALQAGFLIVKDTPDN